MNNELALQIRTKKLAVLIRDARMSAGRTKKECAQALGLTTGAYGAYERGSKAPSLPEVEALAFFLQVPVEHFWGSTALSEAQPEESFSDRISKSIETRQQAVGQALLEAREQAGRSQADVSRETGIPAARLRRYESGSHSVPVPELELLAQTLGLSVQSMIGGQGPVGDWMRERNALLQLKEMPAELQEFVVKPYNRPYIEIALRLSAMEVNKLRSVAEGLLDITL